jgi:hypothetical protein
MTYKIDRYRNGNLMAEGARVNADTPEEALRKAAELFPECPDDAFKIRGER